MTPVHQISCGEKHSIITFNGLPYTSGSNIDYQNGKKTKTDYFDLINSIDTKHYYDIFATKNYSMIFFKAKVKCFGKFQTEFSGN
jgi:hypothetical protein